MDAWDTKRPSVFGKHALEEHFPPWPIDVVSKGKFKDNYVRSGPAYRYYRGKLTLVTVLLFASETRCPRCATLARLRLVSKLKLSRVTPEYVNSRSYFTGCREGRACVMHRMRTYTSEKEVDVTVLEKKKGCRFIKKKSFFVLFCRVAYFARYDNSLSEFCHFFGFPGPLSESGVL